MPSIPGAGKDRGIGQIFLGVRVKDPVKNAWRVGSLIARDEQIWTRAFKKKKTGNGRGR